LLLLIAAVGFNTARKGSQQMVVAPLAPIKVDEAGAATRLGEAVRLKTISSRDDAKLNTDQFLAFHALLKAKFPKVHATLKRETVGDLSLLYTWQGADPRPNPSCCWPTRTWFPWPPAPKATGRWSPFPAW